MGVVQAAGLRVGEVFCLMQATEPVALRGQTLAYYRTLTAKRSLGLTE